MAQRGGTGIAAATPAAQASAAAPGISQGRCWRFGDASLDERSHELRVAGQLVHVEKKPLEVLLFLLGHAGEVVTKDEFAEALWPGRILTETVLTKCVGKLRAALGDDDQSVIRTVHGYGYRLVAPVRIDSELPEPPAANPQLGAGQAPPLRPGWILERALGSGGRGEAWLVRHAGSGEARVLKFARDGLSLTSLKREITLSRLLASLLPERTDFVRIADWNLEQAPYFIEMAWADGGNLLQFLDRGSGAAVPERPQRIELVAQVAEALAAAHSVGVLHKDLKPANVLVDTGGAPGPQGHGAATPGPRIRLADFGSGSVIDPARLDALGITRLGFTHTVASSRDDSGTLAYLAPECLAGQPFTVQSDIYALGVILYQAVVGDCTRVLAPGWEQDVDDPLLREDIALAAAGNPERRGADAAQLALRLRTLEQRRAQRAQDAAAAERAARAQRDLEHLQARRRRVRAGVAVLGGALVVTSTLLWRARVEQQRADRAGEVTAAVSDFLNRDLLSAARLDVAPTRDLRLRDLLDAAAAKVDERLAHQPEAAAQVHASLGDSYYNLSLYEQALAEREKAFALQARLHGDNSAQALVLTAALATAHATLGHSADAIALYRQAIAGMTALHGPGHPPLGPLRVELADTLFAAGDFAGAATELQAFLDDPRASAILSEADAVDARGRLASFRYWLGDYAAAEAAQRQNLEVRLRLFGDDHLATAVARIGLGATLLETGRLADAEAQLADATATVERWVGPDDSFLALARFTLGRLRLAQGRVDEGVTLLREAERIRLAAFGERSSFVAWTRSQLALALGARGEIAPALEMAQAALVVTAAADGADNPFTLYQQLGVAALLREAGRTAEAAAQLDQLPEAALARLPQDHPLRGLLRYERGMLAAARGDVAQARGELVAAQRLLEARNPEGAPAQRARAALARLDPEEPDHG